MRKVTKVTKNYSNSYDEENENSIYMVNLCVQTKIMIRIKITSLPTLPIQFL